MENYETYTSKVDLSQLKDKESVANLPQSCNSSLKALYDKLELAKIKFAVQSTVEWIKVFVNGADKKIADQALRNIT